MVDLGAIVAFGKVELRARRMKDVVVDRELVGELEGGWGVIRGLAVYSMGDLGSH